MRFLLDANLSPSMTDRFEAAGHEAIHVRDVSLRHASDVAILEFAVDRDLIVISQDSDFTNLLASRGAARPSLILLRGTQAVAAEAIADLVLVNLEQVTGALEEGAVVSLLVDRVRVRRLPIG